MPLPLLEELSTDLGTLAPVCTGTFLVSLAIKQLTEQRRPPVQTGNGSGAFQRPAPVGKPCRQCGGRRKCTCVACEGRGRTNRSAAEVLSKREFPQWCGYCRGSGLCACTNCLGTGLQPKKMGFRLPGEEDGDA